MPTSPRLGSRDPEVLLHQCIARFDGLATEVMGALDALDSAPPADRAIQLNRVTLSTGKVLGMLEAIIIVGPESAARPRRVAEEVVRRIESIRESLHLPPTA